MHAGRKTNKSDRIWANKIGKDKSMKRELTICIGKEEADRIEKLLSVKPKNQKECFGPDETIMHTADFGGGIEMDVKLCGVAYEEDSDNLPWTEAVLFHDGCQVAMCEPDEEYFTVWELEYEGVTYAVNVTRE